MKEPLANRMLFPITERQFTYASYDRWLERLADVDVVPLGELAGAPADDRPVLALRHDVDSRLESAVALGRLEHRRGLRATYFVLHTAPYYRDRGAVVDALHILQDKLGHEIGWHNDLGTLALLDGVDIAGFLRSELSWIRGEGIVVRGAAAHGSPYCERLGYDNNYVFAGWDEAVPGRPRTDLPAKLVPADYGLEYEAYHLPYDRYFSDSSFDSRGRRWHPDALPALRAGERAVVLVHPCHWDASTAAKWLRLTGKVVARLGGRLVGRDRQLVPHTIENPILESDGQPIGDRDADPPR